MRGHCDIVDVVMTAPQLAEVSRRLPVAVSSITNTLQKYATGRDLYSAQLRLQYTQDCCCHLYLQLDLLLHALASVAHACRVMDCCWYVCLFQMHALPSRRVFRYKSWRRCSLDGAPCRYSIGRSPHRRDRTPGHDSVAASWRVRVAQKVVRRQTASHSDAEVIEPKEVMGFSGHMAGTWQALCCSHVFVLVPFLCCRSLQVSACNEPYCRRQHSAGT